MTQYYDIPDLDKLMRAAGATNVELSQKSGCSLSTIALLRVGRAKARKNTVETILETLATRKFKKPYQRS